MSNFANDDSDNFQLLRNPLTELFQALRDGANYSTRTMKIQLTVWFQGEKVGGLNRILWHFYISKVFARNHGSPDLLRNHGFEWTKHNATHYYWKLEGIQHHQLFRAAIEEMTGYPINVR